MADTALLDGNHRVLTPEYVEFDFVLAGLFSRFLAWLLDTVITAAFSGIVSLLAVFVLFIAPGFGMAVAIVSYFLIDWGYAILLESIWSGQTIGKRVMGLRVIQESGVRIGPLQAVMRNLTRPLDRLPVMYGVGGAVALFTESTQRPGDLFAGTIVVRERRLKVPAALTQPDAEAGLSADPTFRQKLARLSSEEETLLFSAAIRREELSIEARLNLFAALSNHLQESIGLYQPPHLSDEKLVLSVASVLAQKNAAAAGRKTLRRPGGPGSPGSPERRFLQK